MKASAFVILALAGIGLAAPAVVSDTISPHAGQSYKAVTLPPGEDWKAIATRDESPLPIAESSDTLVVSIDAPVEAMVPDGSGWADYLHFTMSYSEFCENGALKARSWWSNGRDKYELPVNNHDQTRMHLLTTDNKVYELVAGPFNFDSHTFSFQSGGYSSANAGLTVRGAHPQDPDTDFQLFTPTLAAPTTITATPIPIDEDEAVAQASTVILQPAIIQTAVPISPDHTLTSTILPFHLQIWEYCIDDRRLAHGMYTNGNMKQEVSLSAGLITSINHRVPGYPNLEVMPYDYTRSRVVFRYQGCEWGDDETWKSCESEGCAD
ncbi:hypothetical protein N0V94_008864 [Neodidymelliopsis sp. IMI 364377]|nr:hypothetical protein N0V94_008864 [Neodidymelliopsis sp. IMI 364377]